MRHLFISLLVLGAAAPVLLAGEDLGALLAAGEVERAVAEAPDADALLAATLALPDETARAVAHEVVQLRGVLAEAGPAAAWLLLLSERKGGCAPALEGAGYLLLSAGRPKEAAEALVQATALEETGFALAYLAEAWRRDGELGKAGQILRRAAARADAPRLFVEDSALALAQRLRAGRDRAYVDLLVAMRLPLRAALWLADDADLEREEATAAELRRQALGLFLGSLADDSPPEVWWTAARTAEGDTRFAWLSRAVATGRDPADPSRHACPEAVLELARECARRGRAVAALSLAQERLRYGECPAAWDVIESLPPDLRAP